MMSIINFRYTPTAGDYVGGMWAQLRRRPLTRAWLATSAPVTLIILIALPLSLLQGGRALTLSYVLPLLAAMLPFAVPWLVYFAVLPLRLRSQVKNNARLRSETFGQADERGLILRHRYGEAQLDWDTFATFFETRGLFLLPHSANGQLYQVIPKRGFESAQEEVAFRELLRRKVGGVAAPQAPGRP